MHRAIDPFLRRLAPLIALFLLAAAGIGVLLSQALGAQALPNTRMSNQLPVAGSTATATPTGSASVTKTPPPTPTTSPSGTPLTDLGTVSGKYTFRGPTGAKGSWAIFALDGKKRVVRVDGHAPFAVKVNTKALPNGRYTLAVTVVQSKAAPLTSAATLRVKNVRTPTASPTSPTMKPAPTSPTSAPAAPPASSGSSAGAVVVLTNAERAKVGCKPLKINPKLTGAAQGHSADMAAKGYFSHDSQDGRSPFDRMKAAGYSYRAAGENIAYGQSSPSGVMTAWMNSSGHRANILNCSYSEIGVGVAKNSQGRIYWTQDFATPR